MSKGIDYSFSRPTVDQIRSGGYTFVCRYLSGGNGKDITLGEYQALVSAGISVVLVWESTANRALNGFSAGVADAQAAIKQLASLGCTTHPVYFAVDFDMQPVDRVSILNYFSGAASVLGYDRTGIYGGLNAVKAVMDAGQVKYAWQTYAWSYGQWDSRAQLRQTLNGQKLGTADVDIDEAVADDYGQGIISNTPSMSENDTVVSMLPGLHTGQFKDVSNTSVYSVIGVPDPHWESDILKQDWNNIAVMPDDFPVDPKQWQAYIGGKVKEATDPLNSLLGQAQGALVVARQQLDTATQQLNAKNGAASTPTHLPALSEQPSTPVKGFTLEDAVTFVVSYIKNIVKK